MNIRIIASLFVIFAYSLMAVLGFILFSYVASVRGSGVEDLRDEQVSIAFAVLSGLACCWSIWNIWKK